jgi:hypothetical protein
MTTYTVWSRHGEVQDRALTRAMRATVLRLAFLDDAIKARQEARVAAKVAANAARESLEGVPAAEASLARTPTWVALKVAEQRVRDARAAYLRSKVSAQL